MVLSSIILKLAEVIKYSDVVTHKISKSDTFQNVQYPTVDHTKQMIF